MICIRIWFLLCLTSMSCEENKPSTANMTKVPSVQAASMSHTSTTYVFPYDMTTFEKTWTLPRELTEISGLTYDPVREQLLAVNDEKANIYFLNSESGAIEKRIDFGKNADYEGIEAVNDVVYVVKSNGNIYPFDMRRQESHDVLKNALSTTNDVEGLGYDAEKNTLLLACKNAPNLVGHERYKKTKAVYAFSLDTKTLSDVPVLEMRDVDLEAFVEAKATSESWTKTQIRKLKKRATSLSPSAIAVHPDSKDYYVLSSVGRLLIVYDRSGALKHVEFLNGDVQTQPEGMCFTPSGQLIISNEGRGLIAKIFWFAPSA